jgi:hypothetical protein
MKPYEEKTLALQIPLELDDEHLYHFKMEHLP